MAFAKAKCFADKFIDGSINDNPGLCDFRTVTGINASDFGGINTAFVVRNSFHSV